MKRKKEREGRKGEEKKKKKQREEWEWPGRKVWCSIPGIGPALTFPTSGENLQWALTSIWDHNITGSLKATFVIEQQTHKVGRIPEAL